MERPKRTTKRKSGPGDDRSVRAESEERLCPVMLEDEYQDTVGCADGEEIQDDRLERNDDRAESEQQEDKSQDQHEDDHVRQPMPQLMREVNILGNLTSHRCLGARDRANRCRDQVRTQGPDGMTAGGVVAGP